MSKCFQIPGVTREMISAAENMGTTPKALSVQLLTAIFTDEELQRGNCTKPRKAGIVQLDQIKLKAIRGMYIFLLCLLTLTHSRVVVRALASGCASTRVFIDCYSRVRVARV